MDLARHYTDLYNKSITKIESGKWQVDNLMDSPSDKRRGITLIIRPDDNVKSEIQKFLDELRCIDPEQYYYRDQDIHITLMSIISCYNGFSLEQIEIDPYIAIIRKSIADHKSFDIEFRGITASPSCVMIQGFPENDALNSIRENLRKNFNSTDLEQTIDKRYAIRTAHATVVRFRKDPTRKKALLNKIKSYKGSYFGISRVNSIELVYNDWYQRKELAKDLYKFQLNQTA